MDIPFIGKVTDKDLRSINYRGEDRELGFLRDAGMVYLIRGNEIFLSGTEDRVHTSNSNREVVQAVLKDRPELGKRLTDFTWYDIQTAPKLRKSVGQHEARYNICRWNARSEKRVDHRGMFTRGEAINFPQETMIPADVVSVFSPYVIP